MLFLFSDDFQYVTSFHIISDWWSDYWIMPNKQFSTTCILSLEQLVRKNIHCRCKWTWETINITPRHKLIQKSPYCCSTINSQSSVFNNEVRTQLCKIKKKGALDLQLQVIMFTSCLPVVGGSLRLLPPLKLVAMILLKVALNTKNQSINQ